MSGGRNRNKRLQKNRKKGPSQQSVARRGQPQQPPPKQVPLQLPLDIDGLSVTETRVESFKGPIPHPETLRQYDAILPGAAERIIAMAEQEQDHRHNMFDRAVDANISRDARGQWMGFAIAILGLVIAALVIFYGRDSTAAVIGGTVLGGADFVALVALFVRSQKDDNDQG